MYPFRVLPLALGLICLIATARAEVSLQDDTGATIRLPAAARRIVSLAPHITENLYAAGAGARLVGAVDYSDYPDAANRIPRVGGYSRPDLEAIVALKPDLVLTWQSGNADAVVSRLKSLGLTVYQSQPDRLEDIPAGIEKMGRLAGTEAVANKVAADFRLRLANLRKQYAARASVPVFYQVWHRPLLTVGGDQIISDVIRLCGGANVFAALPDKAPGVSVEAVLAANPEAIVASGMGRPSAEPPQGKPAPPRGAANAVSVGAQQATPVGLEDWHKWKQMRAVSRGNLFFVPSDLMQRPTPRLLDGAEQLCRHLETARGRR